MSKLFVAYPSAENLKMENGYNAVLAIGADAAAALAAADAAKPNGSTDSNKLASWTFWEIAGTAGNLPNGAGVMWLDGVRGFGGSRAV